MLDLSAFGQSFKSYVLSVKKRLPKSNFIQTLVLYDVMGLSGIALAMPEERRQGSKYAICDRIQTPLPDQPGSGVSSNQVNCECALPVILYRFPAPALSGSGSKGWEIPLSVICAPSDIYNLSQ